MKSIKRLQILFHKRHKTQWSKLPVLFFLLLLFVVDILIFPVFCVPLIVLPDLYFNFFLIDDFVLFPAFFVLSSNSVFFVLNYVGSLYFHNFSFLMWCKIMFCLCSLPFDDLFSLVRGGLVCCQYYHTKDLFLVTWNWSKQPKTFNKKTISLYRCPKRPSTRESEAKDKRPPLTPRLKK